MGLSFTLAIGLSVQKAPVFLIQFFASLSRSDVGEASS